MLQQCYEINYNRCSSNGSQSRCIYFIVILYEISVSVLAWKYQDMSSKILSDENEYKGQGSSRCSTDYFRWMWMWCNKNSNTIWFILATINSGCNWDCFLLKGMAGYFYHRSMFSPSQVFLRLSRIHRMIGVLICIVLNIVICIQIFLNVLAPIFKSVNFFCQFGSNYKL